MAVTYRDSPRAGKEQKVPNVMQAARCDQNNDQPRAATDITVQHRL